MRGQAWAAATAAAPIYGPDELREPPFARFLFADTRASILWLIVRLYLGWERVQAGSEQITPRSGRGARLGRR
ncbi:MAG TPA: hypothetical protein VF763_08965 [Candidatus Limnocylindrales bacterium]